MILVASRQPRHLAEASKQFVAIPDSGKEIMYAWVIDLNDAFNYAALIFTAVIFLDPKPPEDAMEFLITRVRRLKSVGESV